MHICPYRAMAIFILNKISLLEPKTQNRVGSAFHLNDPIVDELTVALRQTPDRAEQRALTRRLVAREHDQVLRMWMPFDAGFSVWQPHLRNIGGLDMRANFGYGSSTLARLWLDK